MLIYLDHSHYMIYTKVPHAFILLELSRGNPLGEVFPFLRDDNRWRYLDIRMLSGRWGLAAIIIYPKEK